MRTGPIEKLELGRVVDGHFKSSYQTVGMCGFYFVCGPCGATLKIMASDGDGMPQTEGWEHVSVSLEGRTPNWKEMCFVKDLFWDDDEMVIQYHPKKQDYVNHHGYCLHMWRNKNVEFPMPPRILV